MWNVLKILQIEPNLTWPKLCNGFGVGVWVNAHVSSKAKPSWWRSSTQAPLPPLIFWNTWVGAWAWAWAHESMSLPNYEQLTRLQIVSPALARYIRINIDQQQFSSLKLSQSLWKRYYSLSLPQKYQLYINTFTYLSIFLLNPGLAHIFHASFITPKQKFW